MKNPMGWQITGGPMSPLGGFSPCKVAAAATLALSLTLIGCAAQSPAPDNEAPPSEPLTSQSPQDSPEPTEPTASPQTEGGFAEVTAVEVTAGDPGAYTFAVTIQSPDTGCEQYSDWWEVITEEGDLLYRRILVHSHVEEQPFRRTGGPVAVQPDETVIVRAHMNPQGYGTQAMQGSAETGFEEVALPEGFAADLAESDPQPRGCDY